MRWAVMLALLAAACDARAPRSARAPGSAPAPPGEVAPADPAVGAPAPASAPPTPPPAAVVPEAPLEVEARESNPTSAKVTIKLVAWPVDATVFWGSKPLGTASRKPLEIERPRASGPVDLVARAPGYLPFHTRVFTDRDEKLTIRLVRTEDAPSLLGYKRTAGAPPPAP